MGPPNQVDQTEAAHPAPENGVEPVEDQDREGELKHDAIPEGAPGGEDEKGPGLHAVEDEEDPEEGMGLHARWTFYRPGRWTSAPERRTGPPHIGGSRIAALPRTYRPSGLSGRFGEGRAWPLEGGEGLGLLAAGGDVSLVPGLKEDGGLTDGLPWGAKAPFPGRRELGDLEPTEGAAGDRGTGALRPGRIPSITRRTTGVRSPAEVNPETGGVRPAGGDGGRLISGAGGRVAGS